VGEDRVLREDGVHGRCGRPGVAARRVVHPPSVG
jgi:hypothetical protein